MCPQIDVIIMENFDVPTFEANKTLTALRFDGGPDMVSIRGWCLLWLVSPSSAPDCWMGKLGKLNKMPSLHSNDILALAYSTAKFPTGVCHGEAKR